MTPQERAAYRRLQKLAETLEPSLRARYLEALKEIRSSIDLAEVSRLLKEGKVDEVVNIVFDNPRARNAFEAVKTEYGKAIIKGAKAEVVHVAARSRIVVQAPVVSNPILEAVRRWDDTAFQRIRTEVREGLREHVAEELKKGLNPRTVAVALKEKVGEVGLTAYDEKIVASYRRALENGKFGEALARKLHDKRFTLPKGKELTPEQIDKMVAAYRRKLVAFRSTTFARTAAIHAANEATLAAWESGVASGLYPRGEIKVYWVVAKDERLCNTCQPIPELNPRGVVLGSEFDTPIGPLRKPTAHPNCRCTLWVRREKAGIRPRPAPGSTRKLFARE